MTEKDLDIAIEKCERIMEFDTRTLENPESENGHIFEKVYDLLQFLRQLQFATDTNVGGNLIDRQAAIDALDGEITVTGIANAEAIRGYVNLVSDRIKRLPSAQWWIPVTERLPEEPYGCLVTVWDTNPVTMDEFENVLPYFVGWDGEQWNNEDGERCPFEVIAWVPLPTPYREGGQE